ncbi:response regulator [Pigmentibacter ruber]
MATKTILIVDDAAETRIFLKGIINSLGYAFYEAKSGLDALKILNDHLIDLVILDVLMPNLDGYQTLEFINKLKQKQDIKVVFLTGKKGELDQAKIEELNPDDLIHKTVDIQVLKTKLKKLLDGSIPPTKPKVGSAQPAQASAPVQASAALAQAPKTATPIAAKPGTPTPSAATATKVAPTASQTGESSLEILAKITNMPIDVEIVITKLSQTTVTFSAKFQFKEGSQLTIDSPKAATTLKKSGEFNVKVLKCLPENDKFIINSQLL